MAKTPSRLGRLAALGGLTSRVSSSYLGQRLVGAFQDEETRNDALRRLHILNAERMVETMGALKGAAMKVGQSVALAVEGLDLPPEVASLLGQLNDKAEPVPFEEIRRQVEGSLDAGLDTLFDRFEEKPLGTASLGQAHAAWLKDGTPVVVKVLHAGVEDSVATDLAALKSILVSGRILRRERAEVDAIFEEIRERLQEELDYYQEAANLEYFHKELKKLPGAQVPSSYPSHCTDRVLTMDRIQGMPLEPFVVSSSAEARERAGRTLAVTFHEMTYRLRSLQADPHGGNYLFQRDGTVGFIDFGCVKRFDAWWVADYARLGQAGIAQDRDAALAQARKLGAIVTDDPEACDLLWSLIDVMGKPFRPGPFTAGGPEDTVVDDIQRVVPRFIRYPQIQNPREMLYLHRALGGTYSILRKLKLRLDYGRLFQFYARRSVDESEGRAVSWTVPQLEEPYTQR